jgi:transcriptional repressor NrdR
MDCPFCLNTDTKVLDSRPGTDGKSIRRRRECLGCNKRWKTIERVEDEMPLVIKRNLSYQPFDREKLLHSFRVSCGKRPVPPGRIDKAVADIEWALLQSGTDSITSSRLGEMVMKELKSIDEIAYVRYASVYRSFRDVADLVEGVKELLPESEKSHS